MEENVLMEWLEELKRLSIEETKKEFNVDGKVELSVQDLLEIENGNKTLNDIFSQMSTFKIKTVHEHHCEGAKIEGTHDYFTVESYIKNMIPLLDDLINDGYLLNNFQFKLPNGYSEDYDYLEEQYDTFIVNTNDTYGGGIDIFKFESVSPFVLEPAVVKLLEIHEKWLDAIGVDAVNNS